MNGEPVVHPPPETIVRNRSHESYVWERITATVVAASVIGTIIFLAIRGQPITDPNIVLMLRIILSLAVAVFGATVPGFLQVSWDLKGAAIRASGALALFVISFFGSPSVIQNSTPSMEKIDESFDKIINATDEESIEPEIRMVKNIVMHENEPYLKDYVLRISEKYLGGTYDASGDFTRTKRREILELDLDITNRNLKNAFSNDFFSSSDFVGVNFSKANLSQQDFSDAFLLVDHFDDADLTGTNFQDADIRFDDFRQTTLTGANFKGADWFDASGLTKDQISSLRDNGADPCPGKNHEQFDEAAFVNQHDSRYTRVRFRDFDSNEANELRDIWRHYAGPDGLCGLVFELSHQGWKKGPRS